MIIRTNERINTEKYILRVLHAKDKHLQVAKIDKVYYPYVMMIYQIQMKNPKSVMNRKILCVLDTVTGRCAIGDADPTLVEINVDDILVVESRLMEKEIVDKAHDFIFKTVMSKVRVLYVPNIALERMEYFHKLFYVVHCKDAEEQDYFLLADPMDASFTVLDY